MKIKTPEYVLGLIAAIINFVMASVLLLSLIAVFQYGVSGIGLLIYALLFLAIILNFTGVRTCRTNRTRGGVLMIATALPLLIYIILMLTAPTAVYLTQYDWMTILVVLWLLAQVLSIIAAIKCFTSSSGSGYDLQGQYPPPGSRMYEPYQSPAAVQPPYQPPAPGPAPGDTKNSGN